MKNLFVSQTDAAEKKQYNPQPGQPQACLKKVNMSGVVK
jgi:hypothetical protein